jgi:hypothetical protein
VNRAGLEPATYGLTCRTGFHQPFLTVAVWTLPSPETGATRQVSEEPLSLVVSAEPFTSSPEATSDKVSC